MVNKPKMNCVVRVACALLAGVVLGSSSGQPDLLPPSGASPPQAIHQHSTGQVGSVDLSLKGPTRPPFVVEVTLKYTGSRDLEIYHDALPWVNSYSLILIGVEASAMASPLDKHLPIDDPGPATMTIKPGQRLVGAIDLTHRFRDLTRAVKQHDVIIFWSYQLQPIDGKPLPRVGGWFFIPKAGAPRGAPAATRSGRERRGPPGR
jgi:hypothetical protein